MEHFHLRHGQDPEMVNYAFEGDLRYVKRLHPHLKAILDAELIAGNHIIEGSGGWPDKDSIIVSLEQPFGKEYSTPDDVRYNGTCDPHFWHQEYACGSPVHLLIC